MAQATGLSSSVPEYNVLLLGESGAGKSTFINSFRLYLQNETWEEVLSNELDVIIPIKFSEQDGNGKEIEVKAGDEDESECLEAGQSATQYCKSYLFRFDRYAVRLIDTPGMGNTVSETNTNSDSDPKKIDRHEESVNKDKENVEITVKFISNFNELHAIAVILKGNETRYTDRFNYCLRSVMNNLHKSAINNLIFIINFYSYSGIPGELKKLLKNLISDSNFNDTRFLTFDHKCFRYLLAKQCGVKYEGEEELNAMNSKSLWQKSRKSCEMFLKLVKGEDNLNPIKPHVSHNTVSINDTRNCIKYVEPVIRNILRVHKNNEEVIKSFEKDSYQPNQIKRISEFKHSIKVIKLENPNIVCESKNCVRKKQAEAQLNNQEYRKQICCEGCLARKSLTSFRKRLFCGAFELISGLCKVCGCHVDDHQRVHYKIQEIPYIPDEDFHNELKNAIDKQIEELKLKMKQLDNEKIIIETAIEKFKDFLKTNPIFTGEEYEHHNPLECVSTEDVYQIRDQLFRLEMYGSEIKYAYEVEEKGSKIDAQKYLIEEKVFTIVRNTHHNLNTSSKSQLLAPKQL